MMRGLIVLALLAGCARPAEMGLLSRGSNSIEPCTVTREQAVEIADAFCRDRNRVAHEVQELGNCTPGGFWGLYTGTAERFECVVP